MRHASAITLVAIPTKVPAYNLVMKKILSAVTAQCLGALVLVLIAPAALAVGNCVTVFVGTDVTTPVAAREACQASSPTASCPHDQIGGAQSFKTCFDEIFNVICAGGCPIIAAGHYYDRRVGSNSQQGDAWGYAQMSSCPTGYTQNPDGITCDPPPEVDDEKNDGEPEICVGNPINVGTGNKLQHEFDYVAPGLMPFASGRCNYTWKASHAKSWRCR